MVYAKFVVMEDSTDNGLAIGIISFLGIMVGCVIGYAVRSMCKNRNESLLNGDLLSEV